MQVSSLNDTQHRCYDYKKVEYINTASCKTFLLEELSTSSVSSSCHVYLTSSQQQTSQKLFVGTFNFLNCVSLSCRLLVHVVVNPPPLLSSFLFHSLCICERHQHPCTSEYFTPIKNILLYSTETVTSISLHALFNPTKVI